ncbi:MAG: hypothetical protein JWN04_5159, partial [Myxococcaceae bacterium]|nr:hypothetical protein [Myxococcaceae bacterium]
MSPEREYGLDAVSGTGTFAAPGGRCLIVEDDPLLRHFVSGHLIENGWEVTTTSLVREARAA